jgi:hypothetical protein
MSNEENYDSMPQEDMEYAIASQLSYQYYDNNNDPEQIQQALDTYLEIILSTQNTQQITLLPL